MKINIEARTSIRAALLGFAMFLLSPEGRDLINEISKEHAPLARTLGAVAAAVGYATVKQKPDA